MRFSPAHGRSSALGAGDKRARNSPKSLLFTAGAAGVALLVAVANAGGTHALWSDQESTQAGEIATGTASLTARWADDENEPRWRNLLPGETVREEVVLANTGDVALEVTVASFHEAPGFAVSIGAGTCASTTSAPLRIDPDTAETGCIEVGVTSEAVPESLSDFEIQFDGRQVP